MRHAGSALRLALGNSLQSAPQPPLVGMILAMENEGQTPGRTGERRKGAWLAGCESAFMAVERLWVLAYVCVCPCMCVCTCARARMCVCVHVHACAPCMCVHVCIHVYVCTYTQAVWSPPCSPLSYPLSAVAASEHHQDPHCPPLSLKPLPPSLLHLLLCSWQIALLSTSRSHGCSLSLPLPGARTPPSHPGPAFLLPSPALCLLQVKSCLLRFGIHPPVLVRNLPGLENFSSSLSFYPFPTQWNSSRWKYFCLLPSSLS